MIPIKRILLAAAAALFSLPLAAQVPFPGSYSENFDSMGAAGTAPPTGWKHLSFNMTTSNTTWTNATGIPANGTNSVASIAVTAASTTLVATTTPTANQNNGYNAAASAGATSDRVIATAPTSVTGSGIQAAFTNATGVALTSLTIAFDTVRYAAVGTANELPGYWLFVSSDGTYWTNVTPNPTLTTVPDTVGTTSSSLTVSGLSIAPAGTFYLRWLDDNAAQTSPDQIIGLNNVSISVPSVPPTVSLTTPIAGATYEAPASITLTADASDSDGTISKVEFFNGATKLGEATTSPYQVTWSSVLISGSYTLSAKATDNQGATTTSSAVNITVTNADNVAPTVALTAPANGATILTSSIALAATAADTDGVVAKVEFFNGSTKLGEDTTSPYSFNWTGVATGSYTITAVATDNDTAATTSSAVNISVAVPITTTLVAKGATWKYLDNGSDQGTAWKEVGFNDSAWASGPAVLGGGDSHIVTIVNIGPSDARYITTYFRRTFNVAGAAAIQALNMNILRDDGVVVWINGTEVARQNMPAGAINFLTDTPDIISGADETTYFPATASPMPTLVDGVNTIAVEVHQRDGASSDLGFDMELISLVLPGTPPTVSITAPADGSSVTAPAAIAIAADAADADGTVTKVEFFEGANKLGEDTVAPFIFDWTTVPQGSYSLTAKATDNFGQSTTSAVVNLTVNPPITTPPTVAITSPSNNANFAAPAAITIAADAADSDGTVSKVEFFSGATKLGEATSEPYTYNWTSIPVGDYTLTAKATDNLTATTTSSAVVIHVLPNQPPTIAQSAPADLASVAIPATNLQVFPADPENQPLTVTFYGREKTATAGADFTLVTLPDTQHYSNSDALINYFTAQTQWIVAQRGALNIAFVSHMGDMTDGSTTTEYARSNTAMSIIEDPVTTGLQYGIPWGGAPGNHDSSGWDSTYGPSRFAGRPYFQGNYPSGSAVNSYQYFSAGGMDFLHISLGMNPNAAALTWADGILKANPNRRAILTSHSILNVGGSQTSWTSEGTTIYEALKGNPNLFLMLCGHMHGIGRRVDTFNGNTIYSVLQDYQDFANGGDSWLRYFTFSPANNKITTYVIRCNDGARRTDAESQFEMAYNMQGSAPWTTLGTVNVAAGGTSASLPWTGLNANTQYEWYANATDGATLVNSATRSFTAVMPSPSPTVALTTPADGAGFIIPDVLTLTADAADSDGTVAKVEFFDGTTKLGEATSAPYTYNWSNPAVGSHTLTAVATDNLGLTTTSAAVTITVTLPTVTIAVTHAGAGEYGSGRTLEFIITRDGPTTNALIVPLVAGGSATEGVDYSGFAGSVTIPAGSASVTLTLTALSDGIVDGTETVTVSLGTSTGFTAGASSSGNGTIADAPVSGQPWSFGVMADTQFTGYATGGTNGVATDIIDAVNQQFIAHGVDFVIQVGDMTENGGALQLQTRLDHNAALTAAGIKFYGLRGNHEGDATSKAFFQSNFIPSAGGGLNVEVAPFDSASYAVTWKGCKFVLLDYPTSTSTGAMDSATAWTSTVFGEIDHSQAFTFHHKNLLGQNHKDNQFGSSNDANPAQQNAFLAALQANGVRYDMSGHDHMNHRAIVTSPDGLSRVQQIICQSDSTKFYIATGGFSSREQSISDQQLKIGFYTYTVDGPKVTGRYYTAEKDTPDSNQNGTIVANPVWTLQDTFGYSLNGTQTTVARGGSYAGLSDDTTKAVSNGEAGYLGTAMSILAGTNSITGTAEGNRAEVDDVNTGWAPKSGSLVSDVLSLWGMNNALGSAQTDTFTLSLSYDPAASNPLLVSRDGGIWMNAVSGNTGGANKCVGDRPFNAATDTLGTYGYDSATHTAWAVINHNSDFAVASDIAPTVALTAPADGAGFIVPASVTLTADAADSDGTVAKVEFFDGATKLGEATSAPYTYNWSNPAVGSHTLTAVATDTLGVTAVSAAVVIHVVANQPPTVAITSPADGASFIAPATITITADAADTDGTVAKVEFFDGATKLDEDTSAPYAYDWSNIPVGSHVLTAVATDNLGVATTSAAVTITVNLPTVTLAATHASAGESGPDRTLEFTITRTGPATNALVVPLVASGSATADADYSGFTNSVAIPAGSTSVALTLTVLSDNLVEGTETVVVSLGTSTEFTAGTPASADATIADGPAQPRYVAGDWHQHTTYTDGSYSFGYQMARNHQFGLDWWANSEHGGAFNRCGRLSGTGADPLNATVTWASMGITGLGNNLAAGNMWRWQSIRDYSFADVLSARTDYPNKVIIQGYEWNVPGLKPTGAGGNGHEHCSMGSIAGEFDASPNANVVAQFEYQFDMSDNDTSSDNGMGWTKSGNPNTTDAKMVEGAAWLQANHPTTSWLTPAHPERKKNWSGATFRKLNDAAPSVAFGFESMPGHQRSANRGEYGNGQNGSNNSNGGGTYGGGGYFSAKVGGLWDSLLGEGRHFWLFTSSDSHEVASNDFYPGEYQKTYSYASDPSSPQAIVDGLRSGNSFVVQGDLIDTLDFKVDGAVMGSTLLASNQIVNVTITVHDPEGANNGPAGFNSPTLDHLDLIVGEFGGLIPASDPAYSSESNPSTAVIARFDATGGVTDTNGITSIAWNDMGGGTKQMSIPVNTLGKKLYFRLRGSNVGLNVPGETDGAGNPLVDVQGQNTVQKAYSDLWFYSNPVFVESRYFAGDFHQHTTYSDGSNPFATVMAKNNEFGLDWWANSEHGGKFNRNAAGPILTTGFDTAGYAQFWDALGTTILGDSPGSSGGHANMWRWQSLRDFSFNDVLTARGLYPNKTIVQGVEWNVPGHEHCSVGMIADEFGPSAHADAVSMFEYLWDANDTDTSRGAKTTTNNHAKAVAAVQWMQANYPTTSWMVPAHPERRGVQAYPSTYTASGSQGYSVAAFRDLNNAGPDVCFGFESMPGHQKEAGRGGYGTGASGGGTFGGCGTYAAKVGGLWDAMLSEGRHFWLFASSDFHNTGGDFWPGEYQKTYTAATSSDAQSIVNGLRSGNSFVVEGDLIDALDFTVGSTGMGGTLVNPSGNIVTVSIRVHDPVGTNNGPAGLNTSTLDHLDVIASEYGNPIAPTAAAYTNDVNPSTRVIARFAAANGPADSNGVVSQAWSDLGDGWMQMTLSFDTQGKRTYFRLRGSNLGLNVAGQTDGAGNPLVDPQTNTANDAWADLWFYSNPVFVAPDSSYAAWAATHAPGQAADQDTNNTGVPNGVKYFMGAAGSTFTPNPGVVDGAITWPKSQLFLGTYLVEVSFDLEHWDPATTDYADNIKDNGTSVVFTLPSVPGKIFTRLRVVPAP